MRISELAESTGVPVPTLKFYLREGLLPRGEPTARTRADYGEPHLRRVRLVRALLGPGGLTVAAAREVLAAVDDRDAPLHRVLGAAQDSLTPPGRAVDPGRRARAADRLTEVVTSLGWRVGADHPSWQPLVDLLAATDELGVTGLLRDLDGYAAAAAAAAALDVASVAREPHREGAVHTVVVGTLLGDQVLSGLRRLAQVDASARRFPAPDGEEPAGR